jgi:hypothetical protein
VDGEWLRTADRAQVVESYAFAVRNGSAVIVLWYDRSFIDAIDGRITMGMHSNGSYPDVSYPLSSVNGDDSSTGIFNPTNGSKWTYGTRGADMYVLNMAYEWGARAMHEQWTVRFG